MLCRLKRKVGQCRNDRPGRFGTRAENSVTPLRLAFSTSFIFNNMARFVLRFVFSTGACFQQHPSFVFRFVFGYLCSLLLILSNILGSFLKKRYLFLFFRSSNAEKRSYLSGAAFALDCCHPCHGPVWKLLPHHTQETTTLAHTCQANSRLAVAVNQFLRGAKPCGVRMAASQGGAVFHNPNRTYRKNRDVGATRGFVSCK